MIIRRLAVLAASALLLGGGLAVTATDSAEAQKHRAQTYGVVGSNWATACSASSASPRTSPVGT